MAIRERWDRDPLASIKANEGSIHQLVDFHHSWPLAHVPADALPDLRSRRRRQYRLDIYTLGPEFKVKTLAQEEDESFGCTVDGPAVFRSQRDSRTDVNHCAFT